MHICSWMKPLYFNWTSYFIVGLKHPPGNADELSVSLGGLSWFKMKTALKVLEMAHPAKPSTALGASFWQTLPAHRILRDGAGCALCTSHRGKKPRLGSKLDLVTVLNSCWWAESKLWYSYFGQKQSRSLCLELKPSEPQKNFALSSQRHFSGVYWEKGSLHTWQKGTDTSLPSYRTL